MYESPRTTILVRKIFNNILVYFNPDVKLIKNKILLHTSV